MLNNRIIKTTVTFTDETSRVFYSAGGKFSDGKVFMRQDFSVMNYINSASGGLGTGEIKLWNLTDNSSRQIEAKGNTILIEAGWEGKTGKIFEGEISSVIRTKPAPAEANIITTLFCVSGLSKLQKRICEVPTVSQLTKISSLLRQIADDAGLFLDIDREISGAVENLSFNGNIVQVLKKLSTQFKFNFYFDQTHLYIRTATSIDNVQIVKEYNPTDGLLDIPVVTEMGIDLKIFLDPNIHSGDGFRLTSQFANFNIAGLNFVDRVRGDQIYTFGRQVNNNRYVGKYQALQVSHNGSSHEDTWETSIVAMGEGNLENIVNTERLDNV